MRILYLHQFFVTRAGSGGTRSYEFARRLVAAGHEVLMISAAAKPAAGRGRVRRRDVDGIALLEVRAGHGDYVRATASGYPRRIASFAGFAVGAAAAALRAPAPDVVLATSPPLTILGPALAVVRRRRVPLVFEVRDLWPEAPIQMGALSNPAARTAARALERLAMRSAAEVVALSPGMRDGAVAAGADPARVTLIPNAADLDVFSPALDADGLRGELGDGFVASYFGTMGEANDLTQVVEAAAILRTRGETGITFVLQGDGKRRGTLEADVRARGLDNVLFRAAGDKASAARLAAASDACMTIFKDVPILATNSPNKLFDSFAAGRAAIVNTDGWQRELVEANDAGVFAPPGDPAALADRVVELRDSPEQVRRMGANARALAEREFGRDALAERLAAVLERAVAERR